MEACLVCENELVFAWTDLHGEGVCRTCRVPYMILKDGKDQPPEITVKEDVIPVLKEYWEQHKRPLGLGNYITGNPYEEDFQAFFKWARHLFLT